MPKKKNKVSLGPEKESGAREESGWCRVPFDKFDEDVETWGSFVSRLENYFEMLGISDNDDTKRTQFLIHTMGVNNFQQLSDHLSPDKPSSKTRLQHFSWFLNT